MSAAASESSAEPDQGPGFQSWMPLLWVRDEERQSDDARFAANLRMLRVIATLETREADPGEDDPLEQEFARLHEKVDLMLEMISGLYRQDDKVASKQVQLTWRTLSFVDAAPPEPDQYILVNLWLHPLIAHPFVVRARVARVSVGMQGRDLKLTLERFEGELGAAWERYVFRQHRREVSRVRHYR